MTAPVLTFSKGYSLRQKEVAMSRYAAGVGWSAEAVAIALRAIRDAGYTVDVAGESAAD